MLMSILNDLVKSTQPGIAAAEGKVKFWSLCEGLVYVKGELMVCGINAVRILTVLTRLGFGSIQREQVPRPLWHTGATRKSRNGA